MIRTATPARRRAPGARPLGLLVLVALLLGAASAAPDAVPSAAAEATLGAGALAERQDTPAPVRDAAPGDEVGADAEGQAAEPEESEGDAGADDAVAPAADDDATGDDPAGAADEGGAEPTADEGAERGADAPGEDEDVAVAAGSGPRVEYVAEEAELQAWSEDERAWTLPLPAAGGPVTAPLVEEDRIVLTQGLYLLEIDRADGTVLNRIPLPAPALEVSEAGSDAFEVEVAYSTGQIRTVRVPAAEDEPVRFDVAPAAFGWTRAGAEAGEAAAADPERDPTDPWLAFRAAGEAQDEDERADLLDAAMARAERLPFFESANLALALEEMGERERAAEAMDHALEDFGRRGYDPRLLTDLELREAYGFPLRTVRDAIDDGDDITIVTWAPYVWRMASEEAPETIATLEDASRALREAGRRDAADLWRDRAADLRRAGLSTWMDSAALSLGRFGWTAVAALLTAFALAWIVLLAKVWRAQTLARTQRRERAEPVRAPTRLWVPRQASTTEKLSLILILVLAGFMAALAGWAPAADEVPRAFGSGTLAHVPAAEALAELPDTANAHFSRGVSLHVRDLTAEAEAAYRQAGERAPALVNLGLLTNDESLLQAALRVDPREEVARFHLGRSANPSPFHEVYGGEEPLLAVPSPLDFALASSGDWRDALQGAARAPWRALPNARPAEVPVVAWWAILVAYALLLVALVVQLFVPRPRVSRHAPRTPAYHPLALLVPGSGHLDELWGLLLLIPWSLVGMDALLQLFGNESALSLSLATEAWILALLWLANVVGFVVEAASYRRRMRQLRENKPELARSYGLAPRPVKTRA